MDRNARVVEEASAVRIAQRQGMRGGGGGKLIGFKKKFLCEDSALGLK